ncbi:MAG TPA: ABC transporter ATP-binding protein [Bryobacteraceae bacterium]|nr:ABC transporter ATP-binding protein [Bryobacteraceae bacterium]
MSAEPLIRTENLAKRYASGEQELIIFQGLDLIIQPGERTAIIGESGAGKSTLLHLIAGLDTPSEGAIYYKGTNITGFSEADLAAFRNREVGYVWQQHHLLPEFTALENVAMPLVIRGLSRAGAESQARAALDEVGLAPRGGHRAGELSGGEQQRVAIARALAGNPSVLLADEPTGNLDERTGQMIFAMLGELQRRRSLTTVLVTHNLQFARECGRVLKLERGGLFEAGTLA